MTLAELKLAIDRASLDLPFSTLVEIEYDPDENAFPIQDIYLVSFRNHPTFLDQPDILYISSTGPGTLRLSPLFSRIYIQSYTDQPQKGGDA